MSPKKKRAEAVKKPKAAMPVMDAVMKEIAMLAYRYFEQRGYNCGRDLDDWLRAEKEIKKKYKIK